MPRPRCKRQCRRYNADRVFKPRGIPVMQTEQMEIELDEFEAMRLCDHEGLDQAAAGEKMGISRGTIQRLLYSGRKKLLEAILRNHTLSINLKVSEVKNAGMHSNKRQCRSRGSDQ